jgi:hypothetical protein
MRTRPMSNSTNDEATLGSKVSSSLRSELEVLVWIVLVHVVALVWLVVNAAPAWLAERKPARRLAAVFAV